MQIALTFDDGPDTAATPLLLDMLKQYGVRATFFCIGELASEHPEILRRIAAEGHLIGNHTFKHEWWTNFLFGRYLRSEIQRAQEAIRMAAGMTPEYFRSPMGLSNPHLGKALRLAGLALVGWDVRAFDRRSDPREAVARVLERARDGSIIALHDGGIPPARMVAAVEGIISGLRAKGYKLVHLEDLLDNSH